MNGPDRQLAVRDARPEGRAVINMRWSHLSFIHWRLAPDRVQPHVPLRLDLWEGGAWVGLVPFLMEDVRVRRVPGSFCFPETNLRTYVIGPDGRPGVWFFSLDAADRCAVFGGRMWFGLNYRLARMRCGADGARIAAESKRVRDSAHDARGFSCTLIEPSGAEPCEAKPGTIEFFLLERYLLYAARCGRISSGRVVHEPYRFAPADAVAVSQDLSVAAGLGAIASPPIHCVVTEPVEVVGCAPARVRS